MSAEPKSHRKTPLRQGKTRPEPSAAMDIPPEPIDDLVNLPPDEIAPRAKVIDVNDLNSSPE